MREWYTEFLQLVRFNRSQVLCLLLSIYSNFYTIVILFSYEKCRKLFSQNFEASSSKAFVYKKFFKCTQCILSPTKSCTENVVYSFFCFLEITKKSAKQKKTVMKISRRRYAWKVPLKGNYVPVKYNGKEKENKTTFN